jgi:hypothetical protein
MKLHIPIAASLALASLGCGGSTALPSAFEIKSIEIMKDDKSVVSVPNDYFPKVLTLFQSGSVDRDPMKWEVMGYTLRITTDVGRTQDIWLYRTHEGAGAYAIGPTWDDRVYYRGSTDNEIESAINEIQPAIARKVTLESAAESKGGVEAAVSP